MIDISTYIYVYIDEVHSHFQTLIGRNAHADTSVTRKMSPNGRRSHDKINQSSMLVKCLTDAHGLINSGIIN